MAPRVFGIALGYEDVVDHDQLRFDPVLATLPRDLEVAVRLAATGAPHPIDVGEVNGVFFFNVASLARVTHELAPDDRTFAAPRRRAILL